MMNKIQNKGFKRSDTPTPDKLCEFIFNLLKDENIHTILDPACGDCRLTSRFNCNKINYDIKLDQDFLEETKPIDCDLVIINPPFNKTTTEKKHRFMPEVFLDKIIELVPKSAGIMMITPMGFRLNQTSRSKRIKKIKNKYPQITSIITLPIDCFENTMFHTEILCFNLPQLKPHYVYP